MALAQISGYQSNPMAATLDGRTLGLSKMRITKKQKAADAKLFEGKDEVIFDYQAALGIDTTPQGRNRNNFGSEGQSRTSNSAYGGFTLSPTHNRNGSRMKSSVKADTAKMK